MNPSLEIVPMEKFRTTLSSLRSRVPTRTNGLKELPIRVVPSRGEQGCFEVVDGFKRLRAARDSGIEKLAVAIENADWPQAKVLLLWSNATGRTMTPMDEARVVASLVNDDGLTIVATAKLLRRRRPWTSKRYALAKRLALELQRPVDEGKLPVSVAYGLTVFRKQEQLAIAKAIFRGGLGVTNGLALLGTYRSLEDKAQRTRLLRDPMGVLQELSQSGEDTRLALSLVASKKLDSYRELSRLLKEFTSQALPDTTSPGERRLLEAERKLLQSKIICCAGTLSGVVPEDRIKEERGHGSRND